jgi:hypothetical protein
VNGQIRSVKVKNVTYLWRAYLLNDIMAEANSLRGTVIWQETTAGRDTVGHREQGKQNKGRNQKPALCVPVYSDSGPVQNITLLSFDSCSDSS